MSRNIVITGASRGIGKAIATHLQADNSQLHLIASQLESFGDDFSRDNIHLYAADFSDPTQITSLTQSIQTKTDAIDVLINNIGIYTEKPFLENTPEDITRLININLTSNMLLTRALLPLLQTGQHAQLINISSIAAHQAVNNAAVYSASKAAVTMFSNALRHELKADKIRVTALHPGGTNTWNDPNPEHLLDPNDIADMIAYIVNVKPNVQIDELTITPCSSIMKSTQL